MEFRHIDITVDRSDYEEGVKRILKEIRPNWTEEKTTKKVRAHTKDFHFQMQIVVTDSACRVCLDDLRQHLQKPVAAM